MHLSAQVRQVVDNSGSTAWHNSVRSRLVMSADAEGVLTQAQEKMNLGLKLQKEIRLAFVDGISMPCDEIKDFAEHAGLAAQREEETILQLMRAAIQSGGHTARHLLMRLRGRQQNGRSNRTKAVSMLQ